MGERHSSATHDHGITPKPLNDPPEDHGITAVPEEDKTTQAISQLENILTTASVPVVHEGPPPPPNGGYGWVYVICVAMVNAHTWGLNSSYGVFLAHYLSEDVFPGATSLQYAFVGSLSISCALMVSPLATVGARELGTKKTMMVGVVMEGLSLILASFATEIWHLFLTQGILFGLGMGFIFTPSVSVVPQWFTTRRALASAISSGGSGLGGVVYAFATGAMIERLGLQWTFRILGIIASVVNILATLLIKDRNKIIGSSQLAFDLSLFTRLEYVLLLAYGWFNMLGYVVLIFTLADYARRIGLAPSESALVSAIFNLGQGIGRPPVGSLSDRAGRINIPALLSFITGLLALVVWINAKTYDVLIFFALIGGSVAGTFWAAIGPVTAEVVGLRQVPSALNIMWLVIMFPCAFSQPIAMQLVESTGGYLVTQVWTAVMYIIAALCLCMVRGWKIAELRHGKTMEMMTSSGATASQAGAPIGRIGWKQMFLECWKWNKV